MRKIFLALVFIFLAVSVSAEVINEDGLRRVTQPTAFSRDLIVSEKVMLTQIGGVAIKLTNKTGSASVKGMLVEAGDTVDNSFIINDVSGDHPIGVVYGAGVADGAECWVVIYGIAEVLLKDSTTATRGYWVQSADVAGRVDATFAAPNPATHWREIGHALESQGAGTDVLAKITMHFN